MIRYLALSVALALALFASTARADEVLGNTSTFFGKYDGTFVLLDTKTGKYDRYNLQRADTRFSPCSTFKIPNALIGLETGVLSGKDHPMKWDGTVYDIKAWNHDQTLQSAISDSVVWYFQRVAQSIGQQRMQVALNSIGYGNKDTSGGITNFWLGSSLKISANEQVEFLRRLEGDQLPFSKKSTNTVHEILFLKQTEHGKLYGKTGTDGEKGKIILGWFVGFVEQSDHTYIFATNISAADGAYGRNARGITEQILSSKGIL